MNHEQSINTTSASIVFGGGIGLGAFQVGAFEVLQSAGLNIRSVSGSSIGAINGAIIVGNAPEDRVGKLKAFWKGIAVEALPAALFDPWGFGSRGQARRLRNWSNSLATGLTGSPNLFVPRLATGGRGHARALYDNSVGARTLSSLIDFDRLNDGSIRFCLATTDVDAGEAVFFDTAKGDRIELDHLLASSSLLPAFEPVRIGERLLADGGLSCNVPLEAEIGPARNGPAEPLCFVLDLYTPGGGQPLPLNQVVESSLDLMFGMQTRMRLAGLAREWELMSKLREATQSSRADGNHAGMGVDLFYMSYRGSEEDAGFGKPFDLSPATLIERMDEGRRTAEHAMAVWNALPGETYHDLRIHKVPH